MHFNYSQLNEQVSWREEGSLVA